jgi:hypothetical protein
MSEKYRKCFVFSGDKDLSFPSFRNDVSSKFINRVTLVDKDKVKNSELYNETMWILPGFGNEPIPPGKKGNFWEEHSHNFGVMFGFYGFYYENIMDLGAKIEIWIDGVKYEITESFTSFIPAGVKHGPLTITDVKRPIVHYINAETGLYK